MSEQGTVKVNTHSRTGYVKGCRCDTCRQANREYQRQYMNKWRTAKRAKASGETPPAE